MTTGTIGAPLRAVAALTVLAAQLEDGGDAFSERRQHAAARRLAAHAAMTAACVHGVFGDRPGVEHAHERVLAGLAGRARRAEASPGRALGAVAAAALALPPLEEDAASDWQVGAIAFADERLLRALYEACVELAAVALREAASSR